VKEDFDGTPPLDPFTNRALELERVDLEVVVAGARVTFRIRLVILVGQVLELDGSVDGQRIADGAFQVAARLLVARVSGATGLLDNGQDRLGDGDVAFGPGALHGKGSRVRIGDWGESEQD
jgi:hypothetical protein